MLKNIRKKITFLTPIKYKLFYKSLHQKKFNMLDIGCGNHSPTEAKSWFPYCQYYGVDKAIYNNNELDMEIMEQFYSIDLVDDSLDNIADNFFDVIILNHVIEHIPNGLEVIESLCTKLKPSGVIYIEFPAVKSLTLPSMKSGILNFCDDSTHVKLYGIKEIANVLLAKNLTIRKAGTRRDKVALFLLPIILLIKKAKGENLTGFGLWDLFGFAEFVYAEKKI